MLTKKYHWPALNKKTPTDFKQKITLVSIGWKIAHVDIDQKISSVDINQKIVLTNVGKKSTLIKVNQKQSRSASVGAIILLESIVIFLKYITFKLKIIMF